MQNKAYIAATLFLLLMPLGCATTQDRPDPPTSYTSADLLQAITGGESSDDISKNNPDRPR